MTKRYSNEDLYDVIRSYRDDIFRGATKQQLVEEYNKVYKKVNKLKSNARQKFKKYNKPLPKIYGEGSPYNKPFKKLDTEMSLGQVRSEFKKLRTFLEDKTRYYEGMKEVVQDFTSRVLNEINKMAGIDQPLDEERTNRIADTLTKEQFEDFWDIYKKSEDKIKSTEGIEFSSTQLQSMIYEMRVWENYDPDNIDDIIERLKSTVRGVYESGDIDLGEI